MLSLSGIASDGSIAHPVSFQGCTGIFHPARKEVKQDHAVLFVSPWGMEELCTRKFQRVVAERLAAAGVASLRFDYHGAGDALDPEDVDRAADWLSDTQAALDYLKRLSGCSRVVVIAQGLGCLIAIQALADAAAVDSMALLAPVVSGRSYLRELAMWSSMIDDGLGLRPGQRMAEAGAIAGMAMPVGVADAIKKVNLAKLDTAPARSILVLSRPGRASDSDFAKQLAAIGAEVGEAEFEGYDDLVSSPTLSKIPGDVVKRLRDWVLSQTHAADAAGLQENFIVNAPQRGRGFLEQPVQFGEAGRLFGVFCEPDDRPAVSSVLLLGAAYDRHAGWGRLSVQTARLLAREGMASLRFDAANIADSPRSKTRPIKFFTTLRRMTTWPPRSNFSVGVAKDPSLLLGAAVAPTSPSMARLPMTGSAGWLRLIRLCSTGGKAARSMKRCTNRHGPLGNTASVFARALRSSVSSAAMSMW